MSSSAFGPFYPPPLQEAVSHAERLVEALRRLDRELAGSRWVDPDDPTDAERWLHGRPEEIHAFVADVVREWRASLISAELAADVLTGYTTDIHKGFTSMFGKLSPGCCDVPEQKTVASQDVVTRAVSTAESRWGRLLKFSLSKTATPTPSTPRVT